MKRLFKTDWSFLFIAEYVCQSFKTSLKKMRIKPTAKKRTIDDKFRKKWGNSIQHFRHTFRNKCVCAENIFVQANELAACEEEEEEEMNATAAAVLGTDISELNIPYTVCEVLVAIMAVIGNAMVIIVFRRERKLRRRTNYYIISLATADFLVGLLGIPFAILASVGLPTNLHACLFTVSLLVVLCTISIFCLVAVSVDRYWAILHPMGYSRNVRTKTALGEYFR